MIYDYFELQLTKNIHMRLNKTNIDIGFLTNGLSALTNTARETNSVLCILLL